MLFIFLMKKKKTKNSDDFLNQRPVLRFRAASHVSLTEREISAAWLQSLESKENSMF